MKWQNATADRFRTANAQTRCINIFPLFEREAALPRLSPEFWQGNVETVEDFNLICTAYIARYRPNSDGKAGWQYPGSSNYTVSEYVSVVENGKPDWDEGKEFLQLMHSIKSGLKKDIIFTTIFDSSLGKRLIVDGLHRATAMALIRSKEPDKLCKLLASTYHLLVIELRSKWAHLLYPCDFLDLYVSEFESRKWE
jgi:hypothetical protein